MKKVKFKFNQGDVARDKITGFTGVVIARTDYDTGCKHASLQSQDLKDGKPIEWESFDESRLELVESAVEKPLDEDLGGPAPKIKGEPKL